LKITAEKNQESQYVVTIEIDPAELDQAKNRAVKRLANAVRVPGFRPGKAPRYIIERMVGQEALIEEATKDLLPKAYQSALDENKDIKPIADPEVNIEKLDPLTIVAKIPVEPTVTLGDYRSLRHELIVDEVTDEDVQKQIERLLDSKTTWDDLTEERPTQNGDKIEISMQTLRDGETVGEPFKRTGELGKGEILEQLDEQLVGMAVSEERTVEIKRDQPAKKAEDKDTEETETQAPESKAESDSDTPADETPEVETIPLTGEEEEQQGLRPLTFKVKLESVKTKNAPELNDDFAASVSPYNTVEELKVNILKDLKKKAENDAKREVTDQLVKQIVEQASFEMPHVMVHSEAEAMEKNFEDSLKQQKLNMKLYLQYTGKTREEFHEEMHVQAEERLRTALALREVAVREGVSVAGEELDRAVERTVERYTSTLPEETRNDTMTQLMQIFGSEENRRQLTDEIFSRKLAQRLLEIAVGNAPEPGTPVELEDEEEDEDIVPSNDIVEMEREEAEIEASAPPAESTSEVTASAETVEEEEVEETPTKRSKKAKSDKEDNDEE
jgi:trigger factor